MAAVLQSGQYLWYELDSRCLYTLSITSYGRNKGDQLAAAEGGKRDEFGELNNKGPLLDNAIRTSLRYELRL